jgi:hypothetical protein
MIDGLAVLGVIAAVCLGIAVISAILWAIAFALAIGSKVLDCFLFWLDWRPRN